MLSCPHLICTLRDSLARLSYCDSKVHKCCRPDPSENKTCSDICGPKAKVVGRIRPTRTSLLDNCRPKSNLFGRYPTLTDRTRPKTMRCRSFAACRLLVLTSSHEIQRFVSLRSTLIRAITHEVFSSAGKRQGFDGQGGLIVFRAIDIIRRAGPKAFLLENVEGLLWAKRGQCMEQILQALNSLNDYRVYWEVTNTKDHAIPQNRRRIFFVGIRQDVDRGTFVFPEPIACPNIRKFFDARSRRPSFADLPPPTQTTARSNVLDQLARLHAADNDPFFEPWIVDCDGSKEFSKAMYGLSPCLTSSRYRGHWVTSLGRRLSLSEVLRLQGLPDDLEFNVSEAQLRAMVGNAMSITVVARILARLLPSAGLAVSDLADVVVESGPLWKQARIS